MANRSEVATVHVLTVTLRDVRPLVRRRLEVPSGMTLGQLSDVLLRAFDWEGGHLHQFEVRDSFYGPAELVDDPIGAWPGAVRSEDGAVLGRLLPRPGDSAVWTYDLGDDWRHRLQVEAVQPAEPDAVYPRCTAGSGLAPQEDTGRPRPGTFDTPAKEQLNADLAEGVGVAGRDLPDDAPGPDAAFVGIFAELDATTAGPDCLCDECREAGDDPAPSLPVLRRVPDDVLAAAAAATPLVVRALALADWLGSGRAVTPARVLRPADATRAIAELGLDRPVLPPHDGADPAPFGGSAGRSGPRARSAKNLPALHPVWSAAVAADLIELRGQKAVPGPALAVWREPAEPSQRLDNWARLLAGFLQALAGAERDDRAWHVGVQNSLLPMSVMMLYTAAEAPLWPGMLALGSVVIELDDDEDDGLDPMLLLTLPETTARWAEVLQQWALAGVVAAAEPQAGAAGGPAVEDAEGVAQVLEALEELAAEGLAGGSGWLGRVRDTLSRGPLAEVTAFGRYSLARVLRGHGLAVPGVGDLVATPPQDLLRALAGHDPAAAAEEIRGWLDARGESWEAAVREVFGSATAKDDAGPGRRAVLPVLVGLIAQVAGPLLDEWAHDPWLAVPIALGRAAAGQGPAPTVADFLWLAVDALSIGLDDEEDFTDLMDDTHIAALLAEPGALVAAERLDHPAAREVFRMLVRHLDDRRLADRLRIALRGGSPAGDTAGSRRRPGRSKRR